LLSPYIAFSFAAFDRILTHSKAVPVASITSVFGSGIPGGGGGVTITLNAAGEGTIAMPAWFEMKYVSFFMKYASDSVSTAGEVSDMKYVVFCRSEMAGPKAKV